MKKKTLLTSLMSIAMLASITTGATYALFTAEDTANIAITSAKVKVEAKVLEDFAIKFNIPIRTLRRWIAESEDEEKYPRLALSYAYLLARQKQILIDRGLRETYNSQLVKFLLTNCHGMSEKANIEAKTDNKFEVNIKVID